MLNKKPCGLDFGNGWIKICLDGKCSKIPNWHIFQQPKGALTKNNLVSKPMAFHLEMSGQSVWFGQDTLSESGIQEIDTQKYKPEYLKIMFKAILYRWLDQHNVKPDWLSDKRLNVIVGMPPEHYQDRSKRGVAEKVFKHTFTHNKPDYIKPGNSPATPFFTSFLAVKPETLSWLAVNKLKPGYTLIADLGYGTSDLCLYKFGRPLPVSTRSLNNGLLHSHNEAMPTSPWLSELDTMRKVTTHQVYANVTKRKVATIARQIPLTELAIIGGGVRLFSADDIKDFKSFANHFQAGDEFTNARMFERLAAGG